ncbi:Cof-type HAD-IIB family hydrolase [Streptococcus sp. zg-JUN1979]|uniref:Cof-type HAD-IIB family hydrolase n=1 Tax=Streptococcus sp. zg-JUN1979 TaxID=3391450 RepID=UPI0039A6FE26
MIKLIATDMDGTFLDDKGQYDKERFRRLLKRLKQRGIVFVGASGRSLLALERLFSDVVSDMAFVAENGAAVLVDDSLSYEQTLAKEQYLEIVALLESSPYMTGKSYLLSGQKGAYVSQDADKAYIDFISHYYDNLMLVSSFEEVNDSIYKLTANFEADNLSEAQQWVSDRLAYATAVTTGFQSVDIILKTVTKQTGLEHLCQKLGISKEEVMAFGDNLNDYEMLRFVGLPLATSNAKDEIKAISQDVIGHCNDNAVISYIEEFLNA